MYDGMMVLLYIWYDGIIMVCGTGMYMIDE